MAFGVFIHRTDSIYDDSPAERYQFPRQYLQRAQACVGDWIVYYEPVKVARSRGYFAIACVERIVPDPSVQRMFIALIEPGSYCEFVHPVPFSGTSGLAERGLLNDVGAISGRAQAAVRTISPADFRRILAAGLPDEPPLLPRTETAFRAPGFGEAQLPFQLERDDIRIDVLLSRARRDRAFRQIVLRAYGERCAITGLKLINGGGRAEAEAAHIRPVEAKGPDSISNGIALSGTVHWMFDRGLIGLSDELDILVSRQINDVGGVRSLINSSERLLPPLRQMDRPHPHFLRWHRENCFKA